MRTTSKFVGLLEQPQQWWQVDGDEAVVETPPAETPPPEIPPLETPEVEAPEAEVAEVETPPEVPSDPPAPVETSAPKPDWRDKKLAKLQRQLAEAREKAAAAPASGTPDPAVVAAEARRMTEAQAFNDECLRQRNLGEAAFGKAEFTGALVKIQSLFDGADPADAARFNQFLAVANETGATHKLIFDLAGDLDEADRIFNLPVHKQAVALTKLAETKAAPVTKAPKPPTPLGARGPSRLEIGAGDKDRSDELTTEAWMARREAEVKARGERR